jgi:hypothetical protein
MKKHFISQTILTSFALGFSFFIAKAEIDCHPKELEIVIHSMGSDKQIQPFSLVDKLKPFHKDFFVRDWKYCSLSVPPIQSEDVLRCKDLGINSAFEIVDEKLVLNLYFRWKHSLSRRGMALAALALYYYLIHPCRIIEILENSEDLKRPESVQHTKMAIQCLRNNNYKFAFSEFSHSGNVVLLLHELNKGNRFLFKEEEITLRKKQGINDPFGIKRESSIEEIIALFEQKIGCSAYDLNSLCEPGESVKCLQMGLAPGKLDGKISFAIFFGTPIMPETEDILCHKGIRTTFEKIIFCSSASDFVQITDHRSSRYFTHLFFGPKRFPSHPFVGVDRSLHDSASVQLEYKGLRLGHNALYMSLSETFIPPSAFRREIIKEIDQLRPGKIKGPEVKLIFHPKKEGGETVVTSNLEVVTAIDRSMFSDREEQGLMLMGFLAVAGGLLGYPFCKAQGGDHKKKLLQPSHIVTALGAAISSYGIGSTFLRYRS